MSKIFLFFLLLFYSCSTVEFIPNAEYKSDYKKYSKKKWNDVEIVFQKPVKPIEIMGSIVIRNFNGDLNSKYYKNKLKKKLFEKKLDGVWIISGKITDVTPLVIQTQNADGLPLAYYEANNEMGKIKGYPFRYK